MALINESRRFLQTSDRIGGKDSLIALPDALMLQDLFLQESYDKSDKIK